MTSPAVPSTRRSLRLTLISLDPFEARDSAGNTYLMPGDELIHNRLVTASDPLYHCNVRLRRFAYTLTPEGRAALAACEIGGTFTLTTGEHRDL